MSRFGEPKPVERIKVLPQKTIKKVASKQLDITFLKIYPFFQKTNFFQLSLVIRNFSTQMYFEITNTAPRRLIMYKTDSFISADEIKEIVGISKSKA